MSSFQVMRFSETLHIEIETLHFIFVVQKREDVGE